MLSGNFCDLELQTNNIEWGRREFSTVYCAIKRVVFFGTLKVLLINNVSTNYVADCRDNLDYVQHIAISGNRQLTILAVACLCSCLNIATIQAHALQLSAEEVLFLRKTFECVARGDV